MANASKKALILKLRFPEFQQDWQEHSFGEFLTESRIPGSDGSIAKKLTVKLWGNGVLGKNEAVKGSVNTQYYKRKAGQFIYSKLDFLNQAFGIVPDNLDGYESTVDLPCFDLDEHIHPRFLLEYVKRADFYERFGEIADGGRKAKRIQVETFLSFSLAIPAKFSEQQKIADCLSSLDELIAAQGRKVEALKTYKRGLMQQLFPREGETLPRLRFPEFCDAPEWKETKLASLGDLVSGLTYSPEDVRGSGLLVLRSSNVQNSEIALDDNVFVTPGIKGANLVQPNDILICVRNGSKTLIGKSALIPEGMPLCTHGAFMTVFRAHAPQFAFQLMQSALFHKQVAADLGATINSINGSQLLRYRFVVPGPDEQDRIADFLSSLTAQIAAEAKNLVGLKAHKKGLMQQLFPSPVEA